MNGSTLKIALVFLIVFLVVTNIADKTVLSAFIVGWPLFIGFYVYERSKKARSETPPTTAFTHTTTTPKEERPPHGDPLLADPELPEHARAKIIKAHELELPRRLSRMIHWSRLCIAERHSPGTTGPVDEEIYLADIQEIVGEVRIVSADQAGLKAVFQVSSGALEISASGAIGERGHNVEVRFSERLVFKLVPVGIGAAGVRAFLDGAWVDEIMGLERRLESLLRRRIERAQSQRRQEHELEFRDAFGERA